MSVRARLSRLSSAAMVAALIAGASMLAAPTAYAVDASTPDSVQTAVTEPDPDLEQATGDDQAAANGDQTGTTAPAPAPAPEPGSVPQTDEPTESPAVTPEVIPAAPQAPETRATATEIQVTDGSLIWGVKESFRNDIYNFATFEGRSALLGTTVSQPTVKGAFTWAQGAGTASGADTNAPTADVSFGEGVGVHFQSHPMDTGNGREYALDLTFMNPRVLITSPTTGELRLDVDGRQFEGMTAVGAPFSYTDVAFASLTLPQVEVAGDSLTWTTAAATLTPAGSDAFGGFYAAGEQLDPITFSTTGGETVPNPNPTPIETTVTVAAPKATVMSGEAVTLTATVAPAAAAGSAQFFNGDTKLDGPVPVENGTATLAVSKLPVGTHEISAEFTPADPQAFASSTSTKTLQLRVTEKPAGPVSGKVANATLTWGLKESFRKYVVGLIAKGSITTLGSTQQARGNGVFSWTGGTGTAMSDGSKANVSYGAGNGLHLQGHGMGPKGQEPFALDLVLTNPRIVVSSATKGELRIDVAGREFAGMTEVGKVINLKQVVIATLELPAPAAAGKTLTWTGAPATLTAAGAKALGEFYSAGDALDPVTFSLPTGNVVTAKKPTSTTLTASATTVKQGAAVTLTAKVKPNLAGTVVFSAGGQRLGGAISAANGLAKTTIKPVAGVHSITASFTPDSDSYGHSISNAVKVTVEKKLEQPNVAPPKGAQAAGSLSWGVSTAFANYVTGPIAKGKVSTSGVGSSGGVYLFPQATGGSWNSKTQTGSVQYSGSVTYEGHKGLLREGVSNPRIDVTGPTSAVLYSGGARWATLDLGAATKSVGANGEVTWSGVPVNGGFTGGAGGESSYTLPADGLSFTVGAASGVTYGSTSVSNADKKRTVADTAPTTTGIRILTAPDQIAAGAELEFEADGFETGEREMIVALYPGPIVLDEAAGANDAGTVRWLGTLPDDIEPGEYTITVQGSADAGAIFTVVDEKDAKAAKQKADLATTKLSDQVKGEALAAGIVPVSTGPVWLWWVGSGALLLIAATMGGLVALQRRAGTQS